MTPLSTAADTYRRARLEVDKAMSEFVSAYYQLRCALGESESPLLHYVQVAAQVFNANPDEILGPCRREPLPLARFTIWQRLAADGMNHSQIARLFHRDHSDVRKGVASLEGRLLTDAKARAQVARFEEILTQNNQYTKGKTNDSSTYTHTEGR